MKDRSRVGGNRARSEARVGDIAGECRKARVLGKIGGKGLVDEHETRDLLRGERAAGEEGFCALEADKTAASGGDDFHGGDPRKIAPAATGRSPGRRCAQRTRRGAGLAM